MSSIGTERAPPGTATVASLSEKFSFRSAPYPNLSSPGDYRTSKRSGKRSEKKMNDKDSVVTIASSELRSLNDSLSHHYRAGADRRARKPPGAYKRLLDGPDIAQDTKHSGKQPRSNARSKAAARKTTVPAGIDALPVLSVPAAHLTVETEKDGEPLSEHSLIVPIVLVPPKKRLLHVPVLKNSTGCEFARAKDVFVQTERSFTVPNISEITGASWIPSRYDQEQLKVVLAKTEKTLLPATPVVSGPQISGAFSSHVHRYDAVVSSVKPTVELVPMQTGQRNPQSASVLLPRHKETTRTGQTDHGGSWDRMRSLAGSEHGYEGYAFQNVNGCFSGGHYPCDVHTPFGAKNFDKFMWDSASLLHVADCPNIPTVSTFLQPLFYQPQNSYDFKPQESDSNPDLVPKVDYQQIAGTMLNNGCQMWYPGTTGRFGPAASQHFLSQLHKSSDGLRNFTIQAQLNMATGSGQTYNSSISPPTSLESRQEAAKKWIVPAWSSPVKMDHRYYMENAGYLYGPVPSESPVAGMDSHEYFELIPQDKKKSSGENSPAASEPSDASVTLCTVDQMENSC